MPDEQCYGLNALYRLYETAEGWVFLACPLDREWKAFCSAVKRRDLLEDSRFASAAARTEHDAELAREMGEVLATRPADQWEQLLTAVDVACARADHDVGFFLEEHPQAAANRMVVEVDSPTFRKISAARRHN